VRFGLLNAIHFGAPQRRIRFFLLAAKRGIRLPRLPTPTHFHPEFKTPPKISFEDARGEKKWYCHSGIVESKNSAQAVALKVRDAISDLPQFDW
jgi:DNA (cytosine-5)-methyltransferase 1